MPIPDCKTGFVRHVANVFSILSTRSSAKFFVPIAITWLAMISTAHAASESVGLSEAAFGMCLEVSSGVVFQPDTFAHFKRLARTPQGICKCATDRLFKDKVLSGMQAATRDTDKRIGADADFKSYLYMKIMSSTMSCLSSELDSVAAELTPAN
ncbi:MAG: hypothetical protein E6Q78_08265 [Rhodoferax sp.]|nr:MAG: hypothetical protein E6Q78_08265 [Rhodoferax sp.]